MNDDSAAHWEGIAAEWTDWARAPGHEAFWSYRDELRGFLPDPGAATLEIGCGRMPLFLWLQAVHVAK